MYLDREDGRSSTSLEGFIMSKLVPIEVRIGDVMESKDVLLIAVDQDGRGGGLRIQLPRDTEVAGRIVPDLDAFFSVTPTACRRLQRGKWVAGRFRSFFGPKVGRFKLPIPYFR